MKSYKNKDLMYQKLIINDLNYSQTAKELGVSTTAIRNWAIKFGFEKENSSIKYNRLYGKEICKLYVNDNLFLKDLEEKFGISDYIVKEILLMNNIPIKTLSQVKNEKDNRNLCRVYDINHDYFKTWSHNMAYILGFIAADGCNASGSNDIIINLQLRDKKILETIKNELGFNGKIREYDAMKGNKKYPSVSLRFSSKEITNDLRDLGVVENKTLIIDTPNNLPKEYELDYIRGYFDGNGSVGGQYPSNSKGVKTESLQIRVRFSSGSEKIMSSISEILSNYSLKKVKVNNKKNSKCKEICYSTGDSIKLYKLLYKNKECIYLQRKLDKYTELFNIRQNEIKNKKGIKINVI